MPEEFENDFSLHYRDVIFFKKLPFQVVFRPNENEKPAFLNSSSLKSVFEKLPCRDGLVCTVGLTVEKLIHFSKFLRRSVNGALQ